MTVEVIAVIGVVIANAAAVLVTSARLGKSYGNLETKVENVRETLNGTEGSDGLVKKVDGISIHLSALEGKCNTMFPIIESKLDLINGKREKSKPKTKGSR